MVRWYVLVECVVKAGGRVNWNWGLNKTSLLIIYRHLYLGSVRHASAPREA